jgi:hypothetical protein
LFNVLEFVYYIRQKFSDLLIAPYSRLGEGGDIGGGGRLWWRQGRLSRMRFATGSRGGREEATTVAISRRWGQERLGRPGGDGGDFRVGSLIVTGSFGEIYQGSFRRSI